jgi:hypothetical protein
MMNQDFRAPHERDSPSPVKSCGSGAGSQPTALKEEASWRPSSRTSSAPTSSSTISASRTRGRPGARRPRPDGAVRQAHPSGRRDHLCPGRVAGVSGRGPATDNGQGWRRLVRPGRNDPRGEERRQRQRGRAGHLCRRERQADPHAGRVSASPPVTTRQQKSALTWSPRGESDQTSDA